MNESVSARLRRLVVQRAHGISDEGEATVRLLDLNASDRLHLRKTLIKAGRYPSIEALAYLNQWAAWKSL